MLYHKYRPKTLDEMAGNESTIKTLVADLEKEDKPHALLFHGESGCGKTTLGRIVASMLGCNGDDFREIDSADFRGIDTIREIRKNSHLMPMSSDCRVWLLDECHKLSNDGQNALLKALEDSPSHVYYILATTEPQKLLPTIRGRCSQYQVVPLTDKQMFRLLRHIVANEDQELDREIYDQIIQDSQGRPRNAIQVLDQILGLPKEDRLEAAKRQAEIQSKTIELCRALIQNSGWNKVKGILSGLKEENPESIRRAVLGYCSAILLKSDHETAAIVMEQMMEPLFDSGFQGLVFECYSAVKLLKT